MNEKLLSEVKHRERKATLVTQNNKEEKEILPFVDKYQPLVSTIKEALMKKWNLIQDQPLLYQFFKESSIISLRKENYGKSHACYSQNVKGIDRCAACHPLQI